MDPRSGPPQGPPPSYALISRVYQRSLRPVVLTSTAFGAIYAAIWAASSFRDTGDDKQILTRISTFDIVIGILYLVLIGVEVFGHTSAWLQRLALVRIYGILSLIGVLTVVTAELTRIIVHFVYKSDVINACVKALSLPEDECFAGWCSDGPLDSGEAKNWCNSSFNRNTFSDIAWFFAATICSVFFAVFAFGYVHQLSSVGVAVPPHQIIRMNEFPTSTYDPPQYPPPPPQQQSSYVPPYDGQKVPDYEAGFGGYDAHGGDKAPGYDVYGDGKHSDLKGVVDSDDENDAGHRGVGTNPFRT